MEFRENPFYGPLARLAINRLAYAIEHYRMQYRLCAEIGLFFVPHPDQTTEAAYRRAAILFHAKNEEQKLVETINALRFADELSRDADYIAHYRENDYIFER